MRVAVVTLFDANYSELAKYSVQNKKAYCKKHGYDFYSYDHVLEESRSIHWSKLLVIRDVLEKGDYDWVWWVDIDILIANFDKKIEDIVDNSYDMVFPKNSIAFIASGSFFVKNTNLVKEFLNDCYELKKDYLMGINPFVFDYEQQAVRLVLQNEDKYRNITKFVEERVCNSCCKTFDPDVLRYYCDWNEQDNIYQDGDFVIHFCGRNNEQRLKDFLSYLLPKKITVCLLSNLPDVIEWQKRLIHNDNFDITYYTPRIYNDIDYASYSSLINECINETEDEFMIFVNPKSVPNNTDIDFIIKSLFLGYGVVCTVAFGLFGATKELFRKIGLFDEIFVGGEHEDNDFALRLKLNDIAAFYCYDMDRYAQNQEVTPYKRTRGLSQSIFYEKWKFIGTDAILQRKYMNYKKISHRHINNDCDIRYYWNKFSDTHIVSLGAFDLTRDHNVCVQDSEDIKEIEGKIAKLSFKITRDEGGVRIEWNSENDIKERICLILLEADRKEKYHSLHRIFHSMDINMWWAINVSLDCAWELRLSFRGFPIFSTILDVPTLIEFDTFVLI